MESELERARLINEVVIASVRALIAATGLPTGSTVEDAIAEILRLRELALREN